MPVVAPVGSRSLRKVRGLRVLALLTDFYGVSGGIAEYNRFFIKALSENSDIEKIVILPRRSKQKRALVVSCHSRENGNQKVSRSSTKTFEDDVTPTAEPTPLSLPPRRGEDDMTLTAEPTSLSVADDQRVIVLKEMPNKWRYAFSVIATLMTKGPFDVIWCGHLYMSPLAQWVAFISRAKLWIQIHGVEAWQRPSKIMRHAVNSATQVFCVSRYSRNLFLSWSNVPPEKVKVLPNTYDEKRFYRGEKDKALLEKFSGEGKKILLTVGRLASGEMYKGHETIIRLLPELLKKDTRWIYWIAGEGDDRARLEAVTRELGVSEQVRFLGFIQEAQLPDLYRAADVFIMLSKGEGFGIVYLEAMACGLPVIAARGDGSADPLLDGRAGDLVDEDCSKEIIAVIRDSCEKKGKENLAPLFFGYKNFSEHLRALLGKDLTYEQKVA